MTTRQWVFAPAQVFALGAAAIVACGTEGPAGFGDGGTSVAAGSGSAFGFGNSGSGAGAATSGASIGSFGEGGATPTAGTGTGQACFAAGSTLLCCGSGTRTCNGSGEFLTWGPCLDHGGATLTCDGCVAKENGTGCDAGVDSGHDAGKPPPPAPPPAICKDMAISTEPEILVGYSPALGQTVGMTGQIKVWVNDENPPFIAPGEQVDLKTGAITAPGNRTAKAPDGLLWEPALYIAPETPQNGGTPHFPQWVKGWFDNSPPTGNRPMQVPGMDPVPPGIKLQEKWTAEEIWDVSALGLAPGTYTAVFVIHDGDDDRAIGCVTIVIAP
ncbi:MAG: hypothetical protein M3O36_01230 [Myxococcota bacterium]|nr:hypothetical protein [Myxococcota bacterium]